MLSKLRFNNEKHINFISVFLIVDLLLIFGLLQTSNATYVSNAVGEAPMDVALYAFNYISLVDVSNSGTETSLDINLGDIGPTSGTNIKYYKFSVTNESYTKQADGTYKADGVYSDTNIVYKLKIITTTNIGLEYSLYNTDPRTDSTAANLFTTSSDVNGKVATDDYGTYFKYYTLKSRCLKKGALDKDDYVLVVKYPTDNKYKDYKYQDLVESIKIQMESEQVISVDASASLCS